MIKNYFIAFGLDYRKANELLGGDNWKNTLESRYQLLTSELGTMVGEDKHLAHIDGNDLSDAVNILQVELDEAHDILSDPEKANKYLLQIKEAANKHEVFEKSKMHEIMESREEHRKTHFHNKDGDSRYIFIKTDDPGKEIIITTQLFDIKVVTSLLVIS